MGISGRPDWPDTRLSYPGQLECQLYVYINSIISHRTQFPTYKFLSIITAQYWDGPFIPTPEKKTNLLPTKFYEPVPEFVSVLG